MVLSSDPRYRVSHFDLAVLDPRMAPEALDLLFIDMLFVDERYFGIFFGPVDMAEIAAVTGCDAVAFRDLNMASAAL